jgi:hypothetical protein
MKALLPLSPCWGNHFGVGFDSGRCLAMMRRRAYVGWLLGLVSRLPTCPMGYLVLHCTIDVELELRSRVSLRQRWPATGESWRRIHRRKLSIVLSWSSSAKSELSLVGALPNVVVFHDDISALVYVFGLLINMLSSCLSMKMASIALFQKKV